MQESTRNKLLALNRTFYRQVAPHFDATRQGWTPGLLAILPYLPGDAKDPLTVLDVGCGNGRFARLLEDRGIACVYTGVDGSEALLKRARGGARGFRHVQAEFIQADLADPEWSKPLAGRRYHVVLCTATLQHLPGYDLRLRTVRTLGALSTGRVILSFWQFLSSERFRARLISPAALGFFGDELEPGDGFLPWKQGVHAVRYVHQVDPSELARLAQDAGLDIVCTFRADGKEGDLNLYAVLQPTHQQTQTEFS